MAAAAAAGLAAGITPARANSAIKFGEGSAAFVLDETWGHLPTGLKWGWGCGIVADARDRVYVTSRSTSPCVAVFGQPRRDTPVVLSCEQSPIASEGQR